MAGDREELIRQRAYALWEKDGGAHGRHDNHWAQATLEIDAEAVPKAKRVARTVKPNPAAAKSAPAAKAAPASKTAAKAPPAAKAAPAKKDAVPARASAPTKAKPAKAVAATPKPSAKAGGRGNTKAG